MWGPQERLGQRDTLAVRRQEVDMGLWHWSLSMWPELGRRSQGHDPSCSSVGFEAFTPHLTPHTRDPKHTSSSPKSTSDPSVSAGAARAVGIKRPLLPSSSLQEAVYSGSFFLLAYAEPPPPSPQSHTSRPSAWAMPTSSKTMPEMPAPA